VNARGNYWRYKLINIYNAVYLHCEQLRLNYSTNVLVNKGNSSPLQIFLDNEPTCSLSMNFVVIAISPLFGEKTSVPAIFTGWLWQSACYRIDQQIFRFSWADELLYIHDLCELLGPLCPLWWV